MNGNPTYRINGLADLRANFFFTFNYEKQTSASYYSVSNPNMSIDVTDAYGNYSVELFLPKYSKAFVLKEVESF
jgi:hypothetical protein